jgi:antitoxin CcdA
MNERVTVEIDSEILAAAREAGMDLSTLLTGAIRRRLPHLSDVEREDAARQWYEDNKEAVDASNEMIEKHGLFSDGVRIF